MDFGKSYWFVVLDAQSMEYVSAYPLFEGETRAFAYEEFNQTQLGQFTPAVRRMLTATASEEPVGYPYIVLETPEELAKYRPDLEINADGDVMVIRGVPIDAIFPGLSVEDIRWDRLP